MDRISEILRAIDRKEYLEVLPFLRKFSKAVGKRDIPDEELMQVSEKIVTELEAEETARHEAWVKQRQIEAAQMTYMTRRGKTQEQIEQACQKLKEKSQKLTIDSVAVLAGISRSTAHRYYDLIEKYRMT
jgi:response regulator of citrate/malate metabolism